MISLQWYLHYFRESISLNLKWEPAQLSLPTGWQLRFHGSVTCSAQTHYSLYHSDFSDESNDSSLLLWIPTVSVYLGYYIAHVRQFLRFVIQSVQTFFCAYPFLSVVLTSPPLLFTDSNHGNLDLNEASTIVIAKTLIYVVTTTVSFGFGFGFGFGFWFGFSFWFSFGFRFGFVITFYFTRQFSVSFPRSKQNPEHRTFISTTTVLA